MPYIHPASGQVWEVSLPHTLANVSGVHLLGEVELANVGVFPLAEVKPALLPFQFYGAPVVSETTGQWVRTWPVVEESLESAKTLTKNIITGLRDRKETQGFRFQNKILQSDQRSVSRINTVVQGAQAALAAGQPFSTEWKTLDNTRLPLDAAGMLALVVAFCERGQALHDYADGLKAQVSEAADLTALRAIDVYAGWPEL